MRSGTSALTRLSRSRVRTSVRGSRPSPAGSGSLRWTRPSPSWYARFTRGRSTFGAASVRSTRACAYAGTTPRSRTVACLSMSHREVGLQRLICDSQVHAPNTPHTGPIDGLEPEALVREMANAGVKRCVIVPMVAPGNDASASNGAALEMAQGDLGRFGVMAPFDL